MKTARKEQSNPVLLNPLITFYLYVTNVSMTGKQLLRNIPKVDEILKHEEWGNLTAIYPESIAKDALRNYLDELRISIKENKITAIPLLNEIIENTRKYLIKYMKKMNYLIKFVKKIKLL